MLKNFIDSIKPKYIGINISEGQLLAVELNQGTICIEDISTILPVPYWQDPTALRMVFKKVFKTAGVTWVRPHVLMSVPPYLTDQGKRTILEAIMKNGAKRAFLIEEFFIVALGAGVYQQNKENSLCKKIFLLVKKETSYLGLVFAGSVFHVRIIPKGYDDLSTEDLRFELTQLLNNLTPELPQQLKNAPIPKKDLGLIEKAWQAENEKQVYITFPSCYKGAWGETLGEFQISYPEEGEEAVNRGLTMSLPLLTKDGYIIQSRQQMIKIIWMVLVFIIISILMYWAKR